MPLRRSDRWLDWVLRAGAVVFLAISTFSVTGAVEVARGRHAVEQNVYALVALQGAMENPAKAQAALQPLTAHPSPAVSAAAKQAVDAADPKHLGAVIGALRGENARLSERLGGFIDWLYATVAVSVAFGLAILFLLWSLRAAARERVRQAEQRIALAEQEHAHRLATVRGLAATTAHEVNNPLTAMVLNLEVLRLNDDLLTDAMREAVEANIDGVKRISKIVAELREAAAPEPKADVELGTVVDATLRLLAHRVSPRAELVRELTERGRVKAEYVALGQVVSNLLVNAAEAFGDRPAEANRITLASRAIDADWVELSVTDNGPGFDPKAFDALTTPFVTTKPNGNGLGLYACKRIVERFGGVLDLVRLDGGAKVTVRLRRA